jgi:uncharacterized iron-regulated membrane protein
LGLLFALLGLTGSLLVFYPELDLVLNPQRAVRMPAPLTSFNGIVEALQQAEPARPAPGASNCRWATTRRLPPATTSRLKPPSAFAPLILTLDPASLRVTSQRFWGDDLFTWIYDLHYSLLLGNTGKSCSALPRCSSSPCCSAACICGGLRPKAGAAHSP